MIVYDITQPDSFDSINSWLIEIEKNASKNVCKYLVGNKCDLEGERMVTYEQGKEFAESFGMQFIETSAKTASNVAEGFLTMTREIISQMQNKDKLKKSDDKKIVLSSGGAENLNSR
jgi:Ras-related protein Rab-1A